MWKVLFLVANCEAYLDDVVYSNDWESHMVTHGNHHISWHGGRSGINAPHLSQDLCHHWLSSSHHQTSAMTFSRFGWLLLFSRNSFRSESSLTDLFSLAKKLVWDSRYTATGPGQLEVIELTMNCISKLALVKCEAICPTDKAWLKMGHATDQTKQQIYNRVSENE